MLTAKRASMSRLEFINCGCIYLLIVRIVLDDNNHPVQPPLSMAVYEYELQP